MHKFTRFLMHFGVLVLVVVGVANLMQVSSAHAVAADQAQIDALQRRVTALESMLNGGEITVERINVHQIAARDEGYDPDIPALIVTDALDRYVIGINGASWTSTATLGFFGAEPHPRPPQMGHPPSAIDVAYSVAATGLIDSP